MVGWCISAQGRIQPFCLQELYRGREIAECHRPLINFAAGGRKFVSEQDRAKPQYTSKNGKWIDRRINEWLEMWTSKRTDMIPLDYG